MHSSCITNVNSLDKNLVTLIKIDQREKDNGFKKQKLLLKSTVQVKYKLLNIVCTLQVKFRVVKYIKFN